MQNLKTVFMFSGQGSQYFQMGQQLFEQNPIFRQSMLEMDQLVRKFGGYSVLEELYSPGRAKGDLFDQLHLSYPAVFMVEYALAQVLLDAGIVPDLTLGASMGSFAAATVAGCISMQDALAIIVHQALSFGSRCEKGGMIAILASPNLHQNPALQSRSVIAAYNFAKHFVVAAKACDLDEIEAFLKQQSLIFQRLPTQFAFHSHWIDEVGAQARAHLEGVPLQTARIPIACCVHAQTITQPSADYFWRTAREPIRFQELITNLENQGQYHYIDVGPAGTLATFLKYSLARGDSRSRASMILTPYGQDLQALEAVLNPA